MTERKHMNITTFVVPKFEHYTVQERMMRIRLEAKLYNANTTDELYNIAIKTLKADFDKHQQTRLTYGINELDKLFDKQRETDSSRFMFMTYTNNTPRIEFATNPSELCSIYSHGYLDDNSTIPRLFK
jgi:hypothetical protein